MTAAAPLEAIAERIFKLSQGLEVEIALSRSSHALTRFCKNAIHQNVASQNVSLKLRVVLIGGRVGAASTNLFDDESLRTALAAARRAADCQPEDKTFPGLPRGGEIRSRIGFSEATALCSPAERAERVAAVVAAAKSHRVQAAGALSTASEELLISNTNGVCALQESSVADLNLVATRGRNSGYDYWVGFDVAKLPVNEIADRAVMKAAVEGNPAKIKPGAYVVVLEHHAVRTLINYLAYLGFGAKEYLEQRAFTSTRLGQQVVHPSVNLADDASDTRGLPLAFDHEGVPKKTVTLLDKGVARAVVWDSRTAARAGDPAKNTGHALPAPTDEGPLPMHLVMQGGDAPSLDALIQNVDHGIYVTRFHYTNVVEPMATVLTGMTRDGTFLIEKGRLSRPLKNLRYTQSILDALSKVEGLTRDVRPGEGFAGCTLCPAALLSEFHFTGVSSL